MNSAVLVLASLLLPASAAAESAPRERVLVLDVGGEALSDEEAGLIRDAIAAEVASRTHAEVLSSEDVRRVLDTAADKQRLDCATDSCLAELGAALGASRVLHGTVARLGREYVMTVALVDPNTALALGRATARADSVPALYGNVPRTVAELLGEKPLPVLTVVGGAVTAVAGVVAVGSGIGFGYLFSTAQDPNGDAVVKQNYLTWGPALGGTALVATGVAGVGVAVLVAGLIVE